MLEVSRWLAEQGLGHHAEVFAKNGIAGDILRDLSDADLKELGLNLGDRKRLLKAIAALAAGSTDARAETAEPTATPVVPREAERRQLTVMFVDLVGSTELAAQLDPEEMAQVIRAYDGCCAAVIGRWGGHVAKYMGDGVLAYFGWPTAHEDEAERAVRAGLAIVDALVGLETPAGAPLAARIGIASGMVMVGELIGEGAATEQTVVGETPNLAARLQTLAAPGSAVISQGTRRLVGRLFVLADLGPQCLKGFAEPLTAWRVEGESRAEGRFEALRGERLTPLVGREHELGLLLDRFERAKEGEGQVVLLSGEPGIGKSRIVRALRERLEDEPYTPLSHYCSPFHVNSALYPVIGLLERSAGFSRDDGAEEKLAKLEALLALGTDELGEAVALVAPLLGVPTGERDPPLEITPQRQRHRTLEVLVDQVEGLARHQPVLAIYEDTHWADPTTLEALDLVIERVQRLPVLVLITFRPEFDPPWTGRAHVTQLSLSRLTRRHGGALIERVTGGKALPAEIKARIVERTDGVPLFAEELTKTVLESSLLIDAGDHYELTGPLRSLAIPSSLHDSLMARLDRLGPVKEVAQIGAVIGREFSHELLATVADRPEPELTAALDRLLTAEMIFRRGTPPEATYTFKHALVRDTAYESLLRVRRRELHARIVEVLEKQLPRTAEAEPELLAHHCAHAGLAERAVAYSYQAGQRAIARSAVAEAVAQLNRGLELASALTDGPERRRWELDLQVALGGALIAAKGYAAEETGRAFARARELCRLQADSDRLLPVLNGQVLFHNERSEHQAAYDTAQEMLELARRRGDPSFLIPAHRALALTSFELGRFAAVQDHAEQILTLYEPVRHRALASLYVFDQRVVALGYLAWALYVLGYPDQARLRGRQQLAEARDLAHPNTLAQALFRGCVFHRNARDVAGLREDAEALVAVAAEHSLPFFLAVGRLHRGWVWIEGGRTEEGIAEVKRGDVEAEATGVRLPRAYVSGLLAEAHAMAALRLEAARWTTDALARRGRDASPWSHWFEADWHRRNGELLLSLPEPDRAEAEAWFRRALEVGREYDARIWELRAATSLARLWGEQGERQKAHDLLAPVYGWFTEGFDTVDLKDAKALLEELA